ncbi:MAG TPA: RHS repeat-associated core domain-containing protein [Actinocrinis sp.]|jgi:RHS repeat-associated protein
MRRPADRPPADAPQELIDRRFHAIVTDLVGTPTDLVAPDDGTIAWHRTATLWGQDLTDPGDTACPLRFPGQYHDPETGLDYNFQRYYDPATGRYTAPDPLGLDPVPNQHAYVDNPLAWLDPLGLAPAPRPTPPDFIVSSSGDVAPVTQPSFIDYNHVQFPVPEGAYGPFPVNSGRGVQYLHGSGGSGLDSRVTGIRVMDPTTTGTYPHPDGYVNYMNVQNQTVNRQTGQTISKSDPAGHLDACP